MSEASMTLREAADCLQVSDGLIRKWLKLGQLRGVRGKVWAIPKEEVMALKRRQGEWDGWPRLVDVSRELEIHRNLGEAICHRAGLPVEKDFSDDCRIPPQAVAVLESRVKELQERADWIRLRDFAAQMGLPPNVIDNGMRRLKLEFDYDLSGQVIFPEETRRKLVEWRASVAGRQSPIRVHHDQKLFSLPHTAEESAAFFAAPGTPEHATKVRVLIARYRFWIQRGLPAVRVGRTRFFPEEVHRSLLDEISISEAAKFADVSTSTIKSWAKGNRLPTLVAAPSRRSYSRAGLVDLLRERFRNSGKLMGRSHVPVRLLPPWPSLTDELRTDRKVLGCCLRLTGSAQREDLDALGRGHGFIQREVWLTLERWRSELAEGRRPSWSAAPPASGPHPTEEVPTGTLVQVLSFLCAVPPEQFDPVKKAPFKNPFTIHELGEICRLVSEQGRCPRIYDSRGGFQGGDVLLDPWAHDVGAVVRGADDATMLVRWLWRGELRMARNQGRVA